MSAVLQPLESLIGEPLIDQWGMPTKDFSLKLQRANLSSIAEDLPSWNIRYSVQCTRLARNLANYKQKKSVFNEEALTRQIIEALVMAEVLTDVYLYYVPMPIEARRLLAEQKAFRKILRFRGIRFQPFKKLTVAIDEEDSFPLEIKRIHRESNFPRLALVRTRRLLFTLIPYLQGIQGYKEFFDFFDYFLGPALNHLSYLFFTPRLLANIFLLLKHLIPGCWLEKKERQLSWLQRLQAQLQQNWHEIANDAAWMVGGILNCYVLVGALAPIGVYLNVSLFFYDVLVAGLRAFIELRRLNTLLDEFERTSYNVAYGEERREIVNYKRQLKERISSERRQLLLSVVSTSALFLGMCLVIPLLAGSPLLPLISAVLVLSITLATYFVGLWLDKLRPSYDKDKIESQGLRIFATARCTMFSPAASGSTERTNTALPCSSSRNSKPVPVELRHSSPTSRYY